MASHQSKRKTSCSQSSAPKKAKAAGGSDYSYFDAEAYGFNADQALKDAAPLSWRLDGSASLSDWTIVVTLSPDGEGPDATATFHVHKNILAVGPHKSEYFASLFKSRNNVSELSDSTSNIELEKGAFDAFPAMLDYIYSHGGNKDLNTQNAVSMRYLAQYFQIQSLFVLVTDFIKSDLVPKTSLTYLSEAATNHDEKLATAAVDICAKGMLKIGVESFLALSPDLFKRILASKMTCNSCYRRSSFRRKRSMYLSEIVSAYCDAHADIIDETMFAMMTSEDIMPVVATKAAFSLLKAFLKLSNNNQVSSLSDGNIKTRCINALAGSWAELINDPVQGSDEAQEATEQRTAWHRELPEALQIELFQASLSAAKAESDRKDREIKRLRGRIQRRNTEIMRLETEMPIGGPSDDDYIFVPNMS